MALIARLSANNNKILVYLHNDMYFEVKARSYSYQYCIVQMDQIRRSMEYQALDITQGLDI